MSKSVWEEAAAIADRWEDGLTPLLAAGGLAAAAGIGHLVSPVGATLVAAGLYAMGEHQIRTEVPRPEERLYARLVGGGAAVWATTTAWVGVNEITLGALGVGGLLAAIPWYANQRRHRRVQVSKRIAAWPKIAERVGLKGAELYNVTADEHGWTAVLHLVQGSQTIQDVLNAIPKIESGFDLPDGGKVIVEPGKSRSRPILRVIERDPLEQEIPWTGPSIERCYDPIVIGRYVDMTDMAFSFFDEHALAGGSKGSGKSNLLRVVVANLTAVPDAVVFGVDLKGGRALKRWYETGCIDWLATTPEEALLMLRFLQGGIDYRSTVGDGERWEITPSTPAIFVVVDEAARLYGDTSRISHQAVPLGKDINQRGRSEGVHQFVLTQRPSLASLTDADMRAQFGINIGLRMRDKADGQFIFPNDYTKALDLSVFRRPGMAYLQTGDSRPVPGRMIRMTDDHELAQAKANAAKGRPRLDEGTAAQGWDIYAGRHERAAKAGLKPPANVREVITVTTPLDHPVTEPREETTTMTTVTEPKTSLPGGREPFPPLPEDTPWPVDPDAPKRERPQPLPTLDACRALLDALTNAPEGGVRFADLMEATTRGTTWTNRRLVYLMETGAVVRPSRGYYRAAGPLPAPETLVKLPGEQ